MRVDARRRVRARFGEGLRPRAVGSLMRRRLTLVTLVVVALAGSSLAAAAEEMTRTEYRALVEPICKRNAEANKQILKGIREEVRDGKLAVAGRQLMRAAAALQHTLTQLKAVPRPAADVSRLTEWLQRVGDEASLLERAGKALKAGQRRKAESLQVRLYSGARITNSIVVPFEFHYCRFEPSKYT